MSKKEINVAQELRRIDREMKELGRKMREENLIISAELHDRLRLGLQGEAAITHYNDWMMMHGLFHLVVC